MVGFIIYMVVIGIVAGFLACFPGTGTRPMGFFATMVLGIVGSFIGGFLGYVLFGKDLNEGALQASGIIGSIIGAVIALLGVPSVHPLTPRWSAPPVARTRR